MIAAIACAAVVGQDFAAAVKRLEPAEKPKLLIVGFYHFANPGLDLIKADLDDHLSPKRQKEIEALNAALARFKPTKIAVEASFGSPKTNERYEAWKRGEATLTASETEQVGFRLAKQFGHAKLFPIDTKLDLDFDSVFKAATPAQMGQMQQMMGEVQAMQNALAKQTVMQSLAMMNSPEADRVGNGLYLRMLAIRQGENQAGSELASAWWKRNLMWISNLTTVATDKSDRILVICGAGHANVLRSILRDSLDFEVVPAIPYLRGK